MNVALVALLLSAVAITSSSGTTLINCASFTCTPDRCSEPQCPCGTYKDHCGCCDLCYTCPGAQCNLVASRRLHREPQHAFITTVQDERSLGSTLVRRSGHSKLLSDVACELRSRHLQPGHVAHQGSVLVELTRTSAAAVTSATSARVTSATRGS
ncbi:hypothetical protein MTO96_048077 [Rhipicephalus appendiculatus]